MPLDDIQKFLKQYDELTKAVVALGGTMSGWIYHAWQRRREARPQFTLEAKDGNIVLGNHGKESFEIIHATIVLRDVGSKPELAKKHNLVVGVATTVRGGDNAVVGNMRGHVEDAVKEIWKPYREQMKALNFTPVVDADMAHMDFYLTVKAVGPGKMHSVHFERWVSCVPGVMWGISYGPHHALEMAPWHARLGRTLRRLRPVVFHPLRGWDQWKKRRWLQRHLDTVGLLRAVSEGTITSAEAESRLLKMSSRARMPLDEFIRRHTSMSNPQGRDTPEDAGQPAP